MGSCLLFDLSECRIKREIERKRKKERERKREGYRRSERMDFFLFFSSL